MTGRGSARLSRVVAALAVIATLGLGSAAHGDQTAGAALSAAGSSMLGRALVLGSKLGCQALPAASIQSQSLAVRAAALPDRITVPVRVHVIRGTKPGQEGPKYKKVKESLGILNDGFAGRQGDHATNTRFRFKLRQLKYYTNNKWYTAHSLDKYDRQARKKLHRGSKRTLNIYINGAKSGNIAVLGWAQLPWDTKRRPKLDGVGINVVALPGGSAKGYNKGDTLVHEVGHWLGLRHTFNGGCQGEGDKVDDTPAEGQPNFGCPSRRDTCPAPGDDPIHNYMDYSADVCLTEFTSGQAARMDMAWRQWRSD